MRRAAPLTILAFVLVCAPLAAAKPVVLTPKWRVVPGSKYDSAVATDRYVAIFRAAPASNGLLTLIDEQTGKRKTLSIPSCSTDWYAQPTFGGGWLMVGCDLYDLTTNQWASLQLSPQCAECEPIGVGRDWLKLVDTGNDPAHNPPSFYLQNIASGQLINDPATPGGTVYDDLSAPSGSSPLCSPLRYPTDRASYGSWLGTLTFYGSGPRRFALAIGNGSSRLRRCGSSLSLPAGSVVSSRASFFGGRDGVLDGRLLPGLQPYALRATPPDGQQNPASPAAVTARTIYVEAEDGRLYSAPLPTARQISACARYQHERRRRPRVNPCRYS
jgi:hypothetical protein